MSNGYLPNITGSFMVVGGDGSVAPTGAFVGGTISRVEDGTPGTGGLLTGFDASRSSPIYNSAVDRVVPAYVAVCFCIKY